MDQSGQSASPSFNSVSDAGSDDTVSVKHSDKGKDRADPDALFGDRIDSPIDPSIEPTTPAANDSDIELPIDAATPAAVHSDIELQLRPQVLRPCILTMMVRLSRISPLCQMDSLPALLFEDFIASACVVTSSKFSLFLSW